MKRSLNGLALFAGLVTLCVGVAFAAPAELAGVQNLSGRVTVNSGGKVVVVGSATEFKVGDVVDVHAGATMRLQFADDSYVDLVGPARLEIVQNESDGRRVRLLSGSISQAVVGAVALEIQTPYDASLVLQAATAAARVVPGTRVQFDLRSGDFAKVYQGDRAVDLLGSWTLDVRSGNALDTSVVASADAATALPDGAARISFGRVDVVYSPADNFSRRDLDDGSVQLTYGGSDFGQVNIGLDTVLFLADGDSITFDRYGRVIQYSGMAHIYHPISEDSFYDEPIQDASDASVADPRRR